MNRDHASEDPEASGPARGRETKKFRRIYVHAGCHKTGSTAIQVALDHRASRRDLLRHGVYYPPERKHDKLGRCFAGEYAQSTGAAEYLRQFESYLQGTDAQVLLLSNESFVLLEDEEWQRMVGFLSQYSDEIKTIVYFRAPLSAALSHRSQKVKLGLATLADLEDRPMVPYWERLPGMVRAVGKENVIVRKFERSQFPNGDVVQDLGHIIGLPSRLSEAIAGRAGSENESLSDEAILVGAHIVDLARRKGMRAKLTRQNFANTITKPLLLKIRGRRPAYTAEEAEAVLERLEPYVSYLHDEFGMVFESETKLLAPNKSLSDEAAKSIAALMFDQLRRSGALDVGAIVTKPVGSITSVAIPKSVSSRETFEVEVSIQNNGASPWVGSEARPLFLTWWWRNVDGGAASRTQRVTGFPAGGVDGKTSRTAVLSVEAPRREGKFELNVSITQHMAMDFTPVVTFAPLREWVEVS